jgi:hypothetical protein
LGGVGARVRLVMVTSRELSCLVRVRVCVDILLVVGLR